MKSRYLWQAIAVSAAISATTICHAQATRTWISGVGDDVNPCSRTAPCKTWAGAISKTAAGGEINQLDPGGFGALTITKSITIDGGGFHNNAVVSGSNGFIVNAPADATVIIRNVGVNGLKNTTSLDGLNGIRFLAGGVLHVQNVDIYGMGNNGIEVNQTAGCQLVLDNVKISDCLQSGLKAATSAGNVFGNLTNVRINKCNNGIEVGNGARIMANKCDLSQNTTGLTITHAAGLTSRAHLEDCLISNTTTAINATGGNPLIRLAGCTISNNNTGILLSGGTGTFQSPGNNVIAGNGVDGVTPTLFSLK